MTLQASPDDLEAHAGRVAHLSAEVHRIAGLLGPALDRLRASDGSHHAVGVVPPLDAGLREVAGRLTALGELSGGVARRLRTADDTAAGELSLRDRADLRALAGVAGELLRRPHVPTAPRYDPDRWAATPRGRQALARATQLLRGHDGWVAWTAVDAFVELMRTLPPELADAVIAGLDDGALERLAAAVHGTRWAPERPIDERHQLWTAIGSQVSLPTFRRIVAFTDDLDPDPRLAEDLEQLPRLVEAGLIPHDRWYQELTYAARPGPLSSRGDGDTHRFDPSDVTQGIVGNCWFVAAMISAARLRPDAVAAMFTEHPSGLVTVRFADGVEVTVTPDLPVHPGEPDLTAFVGRRNPGHRDVPDGQHERWPKLLEKAMAQRLGGWDRIASNQPGAGVTALLGGRRDRRTLVSSPRRRRSPARAGADVPTIRGDLAAGRSVIVSTLHAEHRLDEHARRQADAPHERRITAGHGYVLLDLAPDGTATVRDPNRPHDHVQHVAWNDLLDLAMSVDVNDLDAQPSPSDPPPVPVVDRDH